jgi:hypothetical protein
MLSHTTTIKPTHKAIQAYYQTLKSYADLNQTHETGVRTAFIRLLEDTAKLQSWTLVTEVGQKVQGHTIRPDATLYKSAVPRGYYEAKDTKDDLDSEIRKKIAKGYPLKNIIFEDSRQAVLYPKTSRILSKSHICSTRFTPTLSQCLKPTIRHWSISMSKCHNWHVVWYISFRTPIRRIDHLLPHLIRFSSYARLRSTPTSVRRQ